MLKALLLYILVNLVLHQEVLTSSDLLEDNGLLLPDRVDGVALGRLRLEGLPLGVHRQAEHVDLHIRPHFFVGQKLA